MPYWSSFFICDHILHFREGTSETKCFDCGERQLLWARTVGSRPLHATPLALPLGGHVLDSCTGCRSNCTGHADSGCFWLLLTHDNDSLTSSSPPPPAAAAAAWKPHPSSLVRSTNDERLCLRRPPGRHQRLTTAETRRRVNSVTSGRN